LCGDGRSGGRRRLRIAEAECSQMSKGVLIFRTDSDDETIELGQQTGVALMAGDVVALEGELGSGKTWFTKGLALGLGISPDTVITSPSFSLMNAYEGRHPFYHMDAYRLNSLSEFLEAGFQEYFHQNGIVVMEWADRWPEVLPEWRLRVEFFIRDEKSREIRFSGKHPRALEILKEVKKCMSKKPLEKGGEL
jgi:tRNA threonylcarbamoyladenosine biosynthesis protein TsaE